MAVTDRFGLHPAMAPLEPAWTAGECAAVPGLGYDNPNRSHFRSIDIWQLGGSPANLPSDGWATRVLADLPANPERVADAVVLGGGGLGPVRGNSIRALSMKDPAHFLKAAKDAPMADPDMADMSGMAEMEAAAPMTGSPATARGNALDHVLAVGAGIGDAERVLRERLDGAPASQVTFPETGLGQQAKTAADLIRIGGAPR